VKILVSPRDTDRRIENPEVGESDEKHLVYLKDGDHNGRLFLFLPGHGNRPSDYEELLRTAMAAGYHVIGLEYINTGDSLSTQCGTCSECYYAVFKEIMYGRNESSMIEVGRPNSIVNRLVMLLAWLVQRHPDDGWGDYLVNGRPQWNKIVAAGHSHGSSQAALIAKQKEVARVVMFAGVGNGKDKMFESPTPPVHWVTRARATPSNRYYGFVHQEDGIIQRTLANWGALGLPGQPTLVNESTPPFGGSHRLVASDQQQKPHGAVAKNASYEKVWEYLIGGAS